ncbi:MAG: rRNA maturation RNase YbeY [Candidatus Yanofskybacteria bacterium RIFCSPHIGHO2_02_FULL_41_11]|uniref:Endoribonuclease YbeY n=1 Tax=Candidatus Yanofskybacteria bacterium RIFCSPHIGHO2_02_FULL_41_11 TaxID=1802675 RepID=A0A1F8FAB3_9BACT|nr:MAG: rRNA maturation RNase YbeY [Candidatus Yanofskybacteria bacterium RIFCSPHIGHO2_02_FULL_41_11]
MIDLVFKNWTILKAPGKKFFTSILEKGAKVLNLNKSLEISINIVGAMKIKELNKKHRNKDKSTDVLSFPLGDGNGDLFICLSIAKKQAKSENISIEKRLARLTVHGFLHLQGHDHERSERDAKKMFNLENQILSILNF